MGKPFGNLFDVPYHRNTHNEIMVNTSRLDYEKRRKTIERRLKRLLESGRIRRITREMIDFGRIALYTYQRTYKLTQEKNHANRFSKLQKKES